MGSRRGRFDHNSLRKTGSDELSGSRSRRREASHHPWYLSTPVARARRRFDPNGMGISRRCLSSVLMAWGGSTNQVLEEVAAWPRITCQSTRTHNSRRRLRRSCWWSGHFCVIRRSEGRGARRYRSIPIASSCTPSIVRPRSWAHSFSWGCTWALGRVAAPASRQVPDNVSGQALPSAGVRASASSDRRRRGARASWFACTLEANYAHARTGLFLSAP